MRPIYVRQESRTRGHVFVVMLAYRLQLKLQHAWQALDITVEEGLKQLSTHCAVENIINGEVSFLSVPAPGQSVSQLYATLGITPPTTFPKRTVIVDTKSKLPERRK